MNRPLRSLQPLDIYSISAQEKRLVIAALVLGKERGLVNQTALERDFGRSFRYLLGRGTPTGKRPRTQQADDRRKREAVPIAYEKWVYLYRHVMNELYRRAAESGARDITDIIEDLHDAGLKTGRYDNDLHLFNSRYLNQDTLTAHIDERSLGCYFGFRLRSNKQDLITSVVNIFATKKEGRFVFHARLADPSDDRDVRGTAYELAGRLFLLGFLNDGYCGEYYALSADTRTRDILYGVMATVNRDGLPHAKQCCFVRAQRVNGINWRPAALTPKVWAAVSQEVRRASFSLGPLRLREPDEVVDLRRYISTSMVSAEHRLDVPEVIGPTH